MAASEDAIAQLAEAERRYSDAVAEARVEAAKIRDGARADAQRIVVEMREQAEREVARIKQRGEDDLVQQRQQVIRELRARIGELSVDLAARLVTEHLSAQGQRAASVDLLLTELEQMAGSTAGTKGEA
jgi:F0F1-type ATP synthase membrane subunit b/b'